MTRLGKVDRPSGLVVQACWVEVPRELLAVGLATVGRPRHLCVVAGGTTLVAAMITALVAAPPVCGGRRPNIGGSNDGRVGGRAGGKFNSSKQRQSAQTQDVGSVEWEFEPLVLRSSDCVRGAQGVGQRAHSKH